MNAHNNQPLAKPLRTQLENTVKAAREVAEKGARAALAQLAVAEGRAPDYLSDDHKSLRRRLRAHGRALGDAKADDDTQAVQQLVWEVAYQHWHRMLFARFLAENGLLLWEPGAAVSLDDCEALVQEADPSMNLGAKTKWELAGILAARMLPQIFKPESPVFELVFAPEHQRELEKLLGALPLEVFQASDSLGWVYQFWQAKRKDEVNASEVKIGADELPAVTQLFTEPYMVDFLLHNSLGAWWVTRHPEKPSPVPLTYLRTLEDGTPAAGKFEGWPATLKDFKLLDPCCGSGHFLIAAFLMLVPMRMAAEGLTAMDAVDYVLQDNLHGLELDARCVEIAVFALALTAWRYPDENGDPLGVRVDMPAPQVACCGLKVAATPADWMALVPDDAPNAQLLRQELGLLHASFAQAPLLGSLLDPARSLKNDLATSSFDTLRTLLGKALATERPATWWGASSELQDDQWDLAITAKGLLDAARLLDSSYHLVITNVPYLSHGKQTDALKSYCAVHYPDAKNELANVFLERCLELVSSEPHVGVAQIVMPFNWTFLATFKKLRTKILRENSIGLAVNLGGQAFETPLWDFNIGLFTIAKKHDLESRISVINCTSAKGALEKPRALIDFALKSINQSGQIKNPGSRIIMDDSYSGERLSKYASVYKGICTGDNERFIFDFWELSKESSDWTFMQSSFPAKSTFGGMSSILRWEGGCGSFHQYVKDRLGESGINAWIRGLAAWGKMGVTFRIMGELPSVSYLGSAFDNNVSVVVPTDEKNITPVYSYLTSDFYVKEVRKINSKLSVTDDAFVQVPFDLAHWQQVAAECYPQGLPKPYSDDPTQWLFHGHPQLATDPLQVAVARLVGYRWPAEQDALAANQDKLASSADTESASSYQNKNAEVAAEVSTRAPMELSEEAHAWIARCAALDAYSDDDGICCLPSVRGEPAAHERLLKLLIASWETVDEGSWKPSVLDKLLADADCTGKSLDVWLRDKFFEQHAKRFHHRPFVWHVWDGLKDGFAALVNYHKLDGKNLERLIHTYLGDWIRQQETGVREGVDGAQTRLAAAQDLKRRLELILEGEQPYDIFVRWKSLAEQPIGWNPDLNDGVRLNIRPFMKAEVLRHNKKPKLNISWDKDRGKDVESAPWFEVFGGDRINDHHLSLAEKRAARGQQ